jgi:hypothetical protein
MADTAFLLLTVLGSNFPIRYVCPFENQTGHRKCVARFQTAWKVTAWELERVLKMLLGSAQMNVRFVGWEVSWSSRHMPGWYKYIVPWLRRSVAGLSPRRPGFDSRPVHVGFLVGTVALGRFFCQYSGFPQSVSFHQYSISLHSSPMLCNLIRWPLKMGPISCPETSVADYESTPRIFPEDLTVGC